MKLPDKEQIRQRLKFHFKANPKLRRSQVARAVGVSGFTITKIMNPEDYAGYLEMETRVKFAAYFDRLEAISKEEESCQAN